MEGKKLCLIREEIRYLDFPTLCLCCASKLHEMKRKIYLQVNFILGEPVFQTSLLPWDNIYFWYAASELSNQIMEKATVLPCSMTIYGVAVEYSNLWKIRADVGICEGFDIGIFDDLIQVREKKS